MTTKTKVITTMAANTALFIVLVYMLWTRHGLMWLNGLSLIVNLAAMVMHLKSLKLLKEAEEWRNLR